MQEIKIEKLNFDFKIILNLCTAIILTLHLLTTSFSLLNLSLSLWLSFINRSMEISYNIFPSALCRFDSFFIMP